MSLLFFSISMTRRPKWRIWGKMNFFFYIKHIYFFCLCVKIFSMWGLRSAYSVVHQAKKKNMCVYCHMSKKSRVGRSASILFLFFLLSTKPEIVIPESDSGISFSKFPVNRHLLKLFYDELHSFSTFFALNFDKKLAVE